MKTARKLNWLVAALVCPWAFTAARAQQTTGMSHIGFRWARSTKQRTETGIRNENYK